MRIFTLLVVDRNSSWLLTPKQVANLLGVSDRTVNTWAEQDKLPAVRLPSGKFRFRRRDIESYVGEFQEPEEAGA